MDFGIQMAEPRSSAHSSIFDKLAIGVSAIWLTLELEHKTVKSSAQELLRRLSEWWNVVVEAKKLNRVGDLQAHWGIPNLAWK